MTTVLASRRGRHRLRGVRAAAVALASLSLTATCANAFDDNHILSVLALDPCSRCDLSGASFENMTLQDMELADANLSGAFLAKADLEFSNMKGVNLSGADLSGADLTQVYLVKADLTNANLKETYLDGAVFVLADLTGANLEGARRSNNADFSLAKFCRTTWVDGTVKNKDC